MRPEKPDRLPELPRVKSSPVVNVPLPDREPFKIMEPPLVAIGLLPSGRSQSLPTVLEAAVFVNVTRLKVFPPHDTVPLVPLKLIVPPLAVNAAPLVILKPPAK